MDQWTNEGDYYNPNEVNPGSKKKELNGQFEDFKEKKKSQSTSSLFFQWEHSDYKNWRLKWQGSTIKIFHNLDLH